MDSISLRAKARLEQLSRPLNTSAGSSFLIDDILVQKPRVKYFWKSLNAHEQALTRVGVNLNSISLCSLFSDLVTIAIDPQHPG